MTPLDLLLAREQMLQFARPSVEYCRVNGIDWHRTERACGGLYMVPVIALPDHRFEPDANGDPVPCIEAIDVDGTTVIDLVAWSLTDPRRVRTYRGAATVLGMAEAFNSATTFDNQPLRLFRTPLSWLQADCEGIGVLDLDRSARWLLDLPVRVLAAEDDIHAADVHGARTRLFNCQRIVVPADADRRAA